MSARDDLLVLDDDRLVALSNRGLVKRARRLCEAGRPETLRIEADGTVVSEDDAVETRLPPGTALSDAQCSCASTGVCRHALLLVMAYRARAAPSGPDAAGTGAASAPAAAPVADIDDDALKAHLHARLYRQAEKVRRAGFRAEVLDGPGGILTVELPTSTVRFVLGGDLAFAQCDCDVSGACVHHALAVWAVRASGRAARPHTVYLQPARRLDVDGAFAPARDGLVSLLFGGASGCDPAMVARLRSARGALVDAGFTWPASCADDLVDQLEAYQTRSARFSGARLLHLVSELEARRRTANTEDAPLPQSEVLGTEVKTETRLKRLRAVSLGCRLWRDDDKVRAEVVLLEPDQGNVLVLAKSFPGPAQGEATGPALGGRLMARGVKLRALAEGHLLTEAVKRRPNRALVLGQAMLSKVSVMPQSGDWASWSDKVLHRDFAPVLSHWRRRPTRFLRPRVLAENVVALCPAEVSEPVYAPGAQQARAQVVGHDGVAVEAVIEHRALTPGAVDVFLAAVKANAVRYLSGVLTLSPRGAELRPMLLVTDRVIALDLHQPVARPDDLEVVPSFETSADPVQEALRQARAGLEELAQAGVGRRSARRQKALERSAQTLAEVGLSTIAARVGAVSAVVGAAPSEAGLDVFCAASLAVALGLEQRAARR